MTVEMCVESVREGFEPSEPITVRLVSSELISASHPPHQFCNWLWVDSNHWSRRTAGRALIYWAFLLLAPSRLEPLTSPLWEARSNQLSYGAISFNSSTFIFTNVGWFNQCWIWPFLLIIFSNFIASVFVFFSKNPHRESFHILLVVGVPQWRCWCRLAFISLVYPT